MPNRRVSLLLPVILLLMVPAAMADTIWLGGTGNWNDPSRWSTGAVPNAPGVVVLIDNGNATNSEVFLNQAASVSSLTLNAGDQLHINNSRNLSVYSSLNNSGVLTLDSSGGATHLRAAAANVTLSGGGTVRLSDSTTSLIDATVSGHRLTNVDNTIEGAGRIGNSLALTNQGLIRANASNALILDAGRGIVNTGTLQANGGTLRLEGGSFANDGGIIEAAAGSQVQLSAATVTGGTLRGDGTANVVAASTLTNVTNQGTLAVDNSQVLSLTGTLTNQNTVQVNSTFNATYLRMAAADVTLNGGGTVRLSDSATNRIDASSSGYRLTNVDNTIAGAGIIGNSMALTNQGLIRADSSNVLILDAGAGITNTGTLQAAGGTLRLFSGSFANEGGIIEAAAGSEVQLSSATVTGGTLRGDGAIRVVTNSTLTNVTNQGTLGVNNSQTLYLTGTLTNQGTLELNADANTTRLRMAAPDVTLNGGGTVRLSDSPFNYIDATNSGYRLTNVNNTIAGAGTIGNSMALTNQGTIRADAANMLILDAGAGITNQGLMQATGGSTLRLYSGNFDNTAGVIEAGPGSQVQLSSATVTGGTLLGDGTTHVLANSTLQNVTNQGTLAVDNSQLLNLKGTLTNQSTLRLDAAGNATYLRMATADVTLNGGGTVRLSDSPFNYIDATNSGWRLTNVDNTIAGAGTVGNSMALTNQGAGTIRADSSNPLVLDGSAGIVNQGLMQADGGTLRLYQGSFTNTGGIIEANGGSQVQFHATTVTGGTLRGTGTVRVTASSTVDSVTNQGTLAVTNGQILTLRNTLTNQGALQMEAAGNATYLRITTANVTLNGGGTVRLSDSSLNHVDAAASGYRLTNVDNVIRGAGNIGNSNINFTNQGTVLADGANWLIIDPITEFINQGTLAVGLGSALDVVDHFTNFAGTTLTGGVYDVAGTLRFAGADIHTNAAEIRLHGPASLIRSRTSADDALRNFDTNTALGAFILNDRNFTSPAAGDFTNAGVVNVLGDSVFAVGGMNDYVQSGGATRVDGTRAASTFYLNDGVLTGSGRVTGIVQQAGGTVMPGNSPGHLTITGDYLMGADSLLEIELGGTVQGFSYDWLEILGHGAFGGTLNVLLHGGFHPADGNTFTVLTFDSFFDVFTEVNLPDLGPDWTWTQLWEERSYTLQSDYTGVPGEIPEPATYVLIGGGLLALAALRRRR